jgi:hypothetical protein
MRKPRRIIAQVYVINTATNDGPVINFPLCLDSPLGKRRYTVGDVYGAVIAQLSANGQDNWDIVNSMRILCRYKTDVLCDVLMLPNGRIRNLLS